MTRQEVNRLLIKYLSLAVEVWPEQRFMQLLMNLDIFTSEFKDGQHHFTDPWNEESRVTLNRAKGKAI